MALITAPAPGISMVAPGLLKPDIFLNVRIFMPEEGVIRRVPPPVPKVMPEPDKAEISDPLVILPKSMVPPFCMVKFVPLKSPIAFAPLKLSVPPSAVKLIPLIALIRLVVILDVTLDPGPAVIE
ncbi:hypothetical protein [Gluconobacter oxydans]|uniref:hypothetical protein n=1 Tax=Gluconobacter oxydans TaxID=442 RepID=UPI001E5EF392|nr:hypothetical protein [Gluconobacter oxydans]